ncbi:MAG: antibiotic biosynthesis monooxygenase [Bacteroidetes bacterium]|nr:antibiotic biosynthesis monooxygenase [Bacteroidota bacterium]
MEDRLKVLVYFQSVKGKESALRNILLELKKNSMKEEGCTGFELLQDDNNPDQYSFIEEWATRQHFTAHLNAPHLEESNEKLALVLAKKQEIVVYTLITDR